MPEVAMGVSELRVRGQDGVFRVFYLLRAMPWILVFHAFAKKTRRTPDFEIKLAQKHLKESLNAEKE